MNVQTVLAIVLAARAVAADPLADGFTTPPAEARPWVWAHWMEGNVDKGSITRNLEAMQRTGIGGLTLFDIGENTFDKDHNGMPPGPHDYLSPSWREMFAFEIAEAARLGLQTMSHAGARLVR
ncbi:MAG: glycosyl hydrolase [Kiritimatiellia bacterium]